MPGTFFTEIYVADAALEIGPDELADAFRTLMTA